jgi:hypothetical protein
MTPRLLLAAMPLGLTAWTCASAFAAPIVMSCQLLDAGSKMNRMGMVDQIVIDTSQRSIDFRVAKTMGTSIPVNFTYAMVVLATPRLWVRTTQYPSCR